MTSKKLAVPTPKKTERPASRPIIGRPTTRLVDELLDASRLARGKVRLTVGPLDLAALLRTAVGDHRHAAEAAGLSANQWPAATVRAQADGVYFYDHCGGTGPEHLGVVVVWLVGEFGAVTVSNCDSEPGRDRRCPQQVASQPAPASISKRH